MTCKCGQDDQFTHCCDLPPIPVVWTGPRDDELAPDGTTLTRVVPPARWPFGPPEFHQDGCILFNGGLFCDCLASASDDLDWGFGA